MTKFPNVYGVKPLKEEEQKGITLRRNIQNKKSNYWKVLERIREMYKRDIIAFAKSGDARDWIPSFAGELRELKDKIMKDRNMLGSEKLPIVEEINREINLENDINDLANDHQLSMQRHESGVEYHNTFDKFLQAVRRL